MTWASRCVTVRVFEEKVPRLTSNNSTGECCDALIDGWMLDRPRPKVVRLDPDGAYVSNAMLEVITVLDLHVQATPPEAPWYLRVLGIVQVLKRSTSPYAMGEGRTSTCTECLNTGPEHENVQSSTFAQRHTNQILACWCGQVWRGSTGILSWWTDAHGKRRWLAWTYSGALSVAGTSTRRW